MRSASSVPLPVKWCANTYGRPFAAARCAEYADEPSSHSRGSLIAAGVALRMYCCCGIATRAP